MKRNSRQRILDAALELFAKDGYKATTIDSIAKKAEVNELTIFRQFKNKKNLFKTIISNSTEKFKNEYFAMIFDEDYKDPKEFLESIIKRIAKITDDNIEFLRLTVLEKIEEEEPLNEIIPHLAMLIGKNIKNEKIDAFAFTLTITGAFILLSNNKYLGRITVNHEILEKMLINNFIQCIN